MKELDTIVIVGVGLIGGSIGLAARRAGLAKSIVGVGRRVASLRQAKRRGAVDRTTTNLERAVRDAQLVIVCTPVDQIVDHVRHVAACSADALITDVGSTKAQIVASLEKSLGSKKNPGSQSRGRTNHSRFLGSHPLAGDHHRGPAHAREDLFDGRLVVLTPTNKTAQTDVSTLRSFWTGLGAAVQEMSAREHDRALAHTSHLPHLIASALAESTPENYLSMAATGWCDTTRVAAGDPELWQQICFTNRDNMLKALVRFETGLAAMRTALEGNDHRKLQKLLFKAQRNRNAVGS